MAIWERAYASEPQHPICMVCRKQVEMVERGHDIDGITMRWGLYCHGRAEHVILTLRTALNDREMAICPKTAFNQPTEAAMLEARRTARFTSYLRATDRFPEMILYQR